MQVNDLVYGLSMFRDKNMQHVCDACQFGKQSRLSFRKDKYMSNQYMELIHTNVWGPTRDTSIGGNRYYVTFIDD